MKRTKSRTTLILIGVNRLKWRPRSRHHDPAVLARFDRAIYLSSATSFSPAAARAFRVHRHALALNALRELDPPTAAELAAHPGRLELDGLLDLPRDVAVIALSKTDADNSLDSLTRIPDAARPLFATREWNASHNGIEPKALRHR